MTLTLATVLAEERVYWGGSCLQKLPCVTRGRGGLLGGLHPPILGTPPAPPALAWLPGPLEKCCLLQVGCVWSSTWFPVFNLLISKMGIVF